MAILPFEENATQSNTVVELKKDCHIQSMVNIEIKKRLYEIAIREKTTISDIVRKLVEKGIEDYEEDKQ
jgi:predicted DNA-binding protein